MQFSKINLTLSICLLGAMNIFAQKLPKLQASNFRAPTNIKIDGSISEWIEGFKAHNSATDFFYTIANDDQYLYVIVQERDPKIILNILNGGISFTFKSANNKLDKGKIIKYPDIDPRWSLFVNFSDKPKLTDSSKTELAKLDSFIRLANTRLVERSKTIKISNIAGLDSVLSIYNDDGIKAASLFDRKVYYNIEIAISLKNLELSVKNSDKFIYQIKINEVEGRGLEIIRDPLTGRVTGSRAISADVRAGQSATYFSGEYTLAKRP